MLAKLITPILLIMYRLCAKWHAYLCKKRSEYQMEQLDDHLLDDIGFAREKGEIVPATRLRSAEHAQLVCEQKRAARRRYAYLIKRRRRACKAIFSGD